MSELIIGAHMAVSEGYRKMVSDALSIGCTSMQFFTRNPRGGDVREYDKADIDAANALLAEAGIPPSHIIAHAPYTMNPCSSKPEVREFTVRTMREDIARLEDFPGILYNFHPGSHTGQGTETGIAETAHCLASVITLGQKTMVLIETMAGKGTEIGRSFEEVRVIIDAAEAENPAVSGRLGVCLYTCHISDAGYDIINDLDGVIKKFDETVGLERLYAVHCNDSKNPPSSAKDRHEKIGEGEIGLAAICAIINHPALRGLPFCLETPNDMDGYAREIELLRSEYKR